MIDAVLVSHTGRAVRAKRLLGGMQQIHRTGRIAARIE